VFDGGDASRSIGRNGNTAHEQHWRTIRLPRGGSAPAATGAQEGGTLMDGRSVVVADLLGNAPEWQEHALCSQTDPEAFFPEKGGSTREAKRICSRCEVRAECLEYALGQDERFGIWGGLSERERRKLKRRAA
jgi:WhiB family redox-sensing transcriptional regulator